MQTFGLEVINDNAQTIDGLNREHGISQIQTVILDKNFATAVYDGLKRENHFGNGIQSVKEVLSSFEGYVEYEGWKMKTVFTVKADKIEVATGIKIENIEKEFLTKEEAQTFYDTLQDTKDFCYLSKGIHEYSQATGELKDDDELIYDITGIEWLRNTSSINLSYNKISDLFPLDIKHISKLADQSGEMRPDALTGEKWYGSYGENVYLDFRGNPINKYPEMIAGRLNWADLDSTHFELKTNPYVFVKEDGANQKFNGEIEIPLIEKGGERIDIQPDSCHIIENSILNSHITSCTKEKIVLNGLTHSGEVKIGFTGADGSQLKGYEVNDFDMSEVISSSLNFLINQSIRIYTPVTLTSLPTSVHISLKAIDSSKGDIGLKGAVFHLYSADVVDGKYVPRQLYNQKDYITDENGEVTVQEKLPSGYYCFVQKKTQENYLIEKNPYGFHIEDTVSLTGGTPELVTSQGKQIKPTTNGTYILIDIHQMFHL